jgi:hypothetical protein
MKKIRFLLLLCSAFGIVKAQTPILDSWNRNTTGLTASYWENANGNPTSPNFVFHTTTDSANVLSVCYNNSWVYVRSEGMTTDMGQFLNPGSPTAQGYVFSFPKTSSAATSPVPVPTTFTVGVLINGIPAFGNGDATSWSGQSQTNTNQGQQVWNVEHGTAKALFWTPLLPHIRNRMELITATRHRIASTIFQVRATPRSSDLHLTATPFTAPMAIQIPTVQAVAFLAWKVATSFGA